MKKNAVEGPSRADGRASPEAIRGIVARHAGARGALMAVLQEIQTLHGYLPSGALEILSGEMHVPLAEVYGVATFYKAFSLKPRGKHLVTVCLGTACHVRGAPSVAEEFERQLKVRAGQTTADGECTLETVNCLGACALGPIVVADGKYYSQVKTDRVKQILQRIRSASAGDEGGDDPRVFPVGVSCPRCGKSFMDPANPVRGCPSIRLTFALEGKQGWMCLSSLYGSFDVKSEFEIPPDAVVKIFCPHCRAELGDPWPCMECDAPMISLAVPGGGVARVCTRRGCRGHMLDLNGVNS